LNAAASSLIYLAMKPKVREILYLEPAALAAKLRGQTHVTLLESVMRHEHLGRYSYLACNPTQTFRDCSLNEIRKLLQDHALEHVAGLPPFQGGLAGYISYEFGWMLEPHSKSPNFAKLCPGLILHQYDNLISFDHMQEKAWIVTRSESEGDSIEKLLKLKSPPPGSPVIENWTSNFTRGGYEEAVQKTVDYILDGDIFQANITQSFSAKIPSEFDAFAYYRRLRSLNPATFAAFLDYGDVQIVSSSPERLVEIENRIAEARPIKGTRRRDADEVRDAELIVELQSSRKDRAENVMIVDLLRNDLSRIAKPGTVKVPVLCGLESYANVHHLVSVVRGDLRDGVDLVDVLHAVFPGGSITGAPKIRAMEIIAELEQQSRGVYCGAIGYLSFNGACDLNIAIRTALFANGQAYVGGGGGITARSQPAAEYEESLTKVKRIMEAFAP
jgi:para-aminobenzoate synthetase component I